MSSVITLSTTNSFLHAERYAESCSAEVSRHGEVGPCERRAVAISHDPEGGLLGLYAVCAYHANRNGSCLALSEIIRLAKETA